MPVSRWGVATKLDDKVIPDLDIYRTVSAPREGRQQGQADRDRNVYRRAIGRVQRGGLSEEDTQWSSTALISQAHPSNRSL